jgi:hypothetical protein
MAKRWRLTVATKWLGLLMAAPRHRNHLGCKGAGRGGFIRDAVTGGAGGCAGRQPGARPGRL